MFHNSQAVLAISRELYSTMFQKTISLNDFYFGIDRFEYPMDNIQIIGKSLGPVYRGEQPLATRCSGGVGSTTSPTTRSIFGSRPKTSRIQKIA
jgi:hypothetical protein